MAFENLEAKFTDLKIEYIWLLLDQPYFRQYPETMVLMADYK